MSVFSRLSDIINANLHSLLDKSEEPEKMIRLMIEEMEQVQIEMRTQAARLIAEQKQLERQQSALSQQMQGWAAKAELAIGKGREDLARAALGEKLAEGKRLAQLELDQGRLAEVLAQLNGDSERLGAKLTEARERQKLLVLREQTAHSRIRARAQIDHSRMHELMARFDGVQGRVDQLEAQLEAATLGQNPSLEAQFRELELNDEIERELARLKGQKVEV
ncbi:phage shock protein A [Aeromonas sp. BIGb0405]|jgi:phage shock protein A|uniref:phage shock protein PspA n=1 Tax=Aeromonas TaxID=642 RepID=UPI001CCD742E|nr:MULTISPECIES: phage shock protein PspA [Aeromonas]MCS3456300.1 phage shock protein A [Aeromonas sp. BIGb0405]UBO74597.1 phage shock protein PspA [Aeromonas rivuli]